MKGPVNLALWLSGAQLFVSRSVFMGACFWLQSQSTLLFWFHSLDSWSTIMSLGTSSLLQGCQSLLRGMGARKIKKHIFLSISAFSTFYLVGVLSRQKTQYKSFTQLGTKLPDRNRIQSKNYRTPGWWPTIALMGSVTCKVTLALWLLRSVLVLIAFLKNKSGTPRLLDIF